MAELLLDGAKTDEKRIQAKTIKSVQASFDAYIDTIPESIENSLIEAPVTENFKTATNKVKSAMTSLAETVQSLDVYLNSVADTFVTMDETIAMGVAQSLNYESGFVGPIQVQVKPIGKDKMYTKPPQEISSESNTPANQGKYDAALPGAN